MTWRDGHVGDARPAAAIASRTAHGSGRLPGSSPRTFHPSVSPRRLRSSAPIQIPGPALLPRSIERVIGGVPLPGHLRGAVVALGNFDGFHLGHQAVTARAVEMARERKVAAIVATFDPHPVQHFRPDGLPFRLTTLDQRQRLLAEADVDALMVFAFNDSLASVTPEAFVHDWLRDVGSVVTGQNFGFGRGKSGSVELLANLCKNRGLVCETVGSILAEKAIVSSSRIRAALKAGDCTQAARLLTRPFVVEGVLRPGKRMDPALPLLDTFLDLGDFLRPRSGVYAVRGRLDKGRVLGGSAYLAGSMAADARAGLELFLVDLTERDLGRAIEVQLIAHLHDAQENYDPPTLRDRIVTDFTEAQSQISALCLSGD